MANPILYEPGYSFANFQANNPTTPLPGTSVDNELADIATSIEETVTALQDVRRSDGALKNGIVTLESLSVGLIAGLADLDEDSAEALDDAVAVIAADVAAAIAAVAATKAELVHTHTGLEVSVSAIAGVSGITVQAVLAELRLLGPQTGDVKLSMVSAAPSGWVACNDGTIGDATSGATTRANADCAALYAVLWNEISDTYAPVTTGRGASAAADFAAHKPIALTKMLGRALAVAGAGSGLTSRANGEIAGAETHALSAAENAAHTHPGTTGAGSAHSHGLTTVAAMTQAQSGGIGTWGLNQTWDTPAVGSGATSIGTTAAESAHTHAFTTGSQGSGTAHANMQPTSFLKAFLKL